MAGKLYAKRDTVALGQLYIDHVDALTAEGLHAKSAIAAELAHRDALLQNLVPKHDLDAAVAALRLLARAWMHNRHRCEDDPYVPPVQTYENWAQTRAYCASQREAMKDALKLIARHEGRSTFGSDWQHALEPLQAKEATPCAANAE